MAKLPPAIQKQVDAAEALEKQIAGQTAQAPVEQPPAPPSDAPATPPAPIAEPPVPSAPPAPPSSDTPPPALETTKPQEPPAKKDDENTWERRYKTLQGMHNHNVADLKARLQQKDQSIASLTQRIEALEKAPATAPAPQSFDQKDVETFGEDMLTMVNRVVAAQLAQTGAQVNSHVADMDQRVQATAQEAAKTAQDLFLERLAVRVPDFRVVNEDEGFLEWLGEPDAIYGVPRQAALDNAASARDVDRVARIFETYKQLSNLAAQGAPAQSTTPKEDASLQKQIAPRAGPSNTAPTAPSPRVYAVGEIEKFYSDLARGRWVGREKEAQAEEAAINAAIAEGRVKQ